MNVRQIWSEYQRVGQTRYRLARSGMHTVAYVFLAYCLLKLFGFPAIPIRGPVAAIVDLCLLWASIIVLLVLVFFVLDATKLCHEFFKQLSNEKVLWASRSEQIGPEDYPEDSGADNHSSTDSCRSSHAAEPPESARGDLKKVRLIAIHSDTIGRFVKYPFAVLLIMVLSRHRVFDNWDWPIGLVLIYVLLAATVLLSAWFLRRSASRARRSVLLMLKAEREALQTTKCQTSKQKRRIVDLDYNIQEISEINMGAFSPLSENPILAALLIPTGGLGAWELLLFLMQGNSLAS